MGAQDPYGRIPRIIEKDAVIDGVELPAQYSRMFEQRVIWSHDTEGLDAIRAIPGAESLGNCYQCGKCTGVCPVDIVGDYSPRKIYRQVQIGIDLTDSADLWLCTTCANCLRVCPKDVNMVEIMPAVRERAIALGKNVPPELAKAFENTLRHGNPMGEPARKRADWVAGAGVPVRILAKDPRPVDVLWWVECYPSYDPRGKQAAQALARLLTSLGVDFAILGSEEKCSCDSQRLAGERGLFELLAEQNIKTLGKYEFKRLLVTDPHALNAFKLHYPKLGASYDVIHYTKFLAPYVEQLGLAAPLEAKVTFHDPCYLGRHNKEFSAPRTLIQAIPGVEYVEMGRSKENSYCCGGGGGGMWLDSFTADHVTERLSERRVREAVEAGAEILAISCPYEVSRFEDAVKTTGNDGKLIIRDIAELLDAARGGATQPMGVN